MPNRTLPPKHSFSAPKTLEKLPKTVNPELGRFDPFSGQSGFGRGRRFWPPTLYAHRPGRRSTARRPCRPNFTVNRRRTRSDQAGESGGAATVGHRFSSFFSHSRPTHTSLPPFLDPLNSFLWSFSSDSSPFKRYDENKFGRRLDRVFRPPQQPLDQGKGTAVFLVSWAFR